MWKKITYLLFILGISIPAFAKPIKSSEARLLANRFLSSQGIVATTTTLDSISGGGTTYMFYMNVANNGGYVLLAADDRILPVLGYSNNSNFSLVGAPSNILKWIEGYKKEIRYALSHIQQADAETQKEWDVLRGIVQKPSTGRVASVPPLLQTTWDQDPYYNALCPYDNTANERAVVGCVATAMSQVMKYHRYPATGSGFHSYSDSQYGLQSANFAATTYNWASMPNSVRSANSAVATLCYHAGVAVDMTYGISSTGGSGAYTAIATSPITNCAEYALKTYFGYDPSTLRGAIRTDYTATTWVNLLKAELDASRPIMYAGSGNQGGHSFVCDGYDNSNRFHFNWGWSGNSDGYFVTNALNPSALGTGGGAGGFNSDQDVIIGIKPIVTGGGGTSGTTTLGLNSALSLSATTVQYLSSFSVTAAITNTGANAFNGDFMACAFSGNTFVDGIDTLRGRSLPAGQSTGTLTFTSSGSFVLIPANYTVSIYYRPTGGATWTPVATRNGNLNETTLTVQNTDNISLYAPITGPATFISTEPCTVTCNIYNGSTLNYYGDLALRLYDLQGNYVAEINSYTGVNLPSNNYFVRNLSFAVSSLDVPPSTYILALTYTQNGYNYLVGSGNYVNPKIITVVSPGLNSDSYEPNNTSTTAYTLTTIGSGNFLGTASNGSNIHVGNDVDFYKVNLPAGYSYTINSRLQDSYSSTDGGNYTVDALYSYSLDNGATFSDAFDDTLDVPIVMNNGGTIMFQVAPWTQGITGTYKLDVPIVRGPVSTQSEIAGIKTTLFPNPTTGIVSLSAPMLSGGIISIINSQGQVVMLQNQIATLEKIDVSSLATGVYFVKLQGKEKTIQLKLVKE